jgi:type I restriction enzyme R subunit
MPLSEADTCRRYVTKKLYEAGCTDDHISEQKSFTDGRIVTAGSRPTRQPQKRADYVLYHSRDYMIAVVEAKATHKNAADGLQQAKQYAQMLGLDFAYSTNGHEIVEHDFLTGVDSNVSAFLPRRSCGTG